MYLSPEADEEREGCEEGWVVEVEEDVCPFDGDEGEKGVVDAPTARGHYHGTEETLLKRHSECLLQLCALLLAIVLE